MKAAGRNLETVAGRRDQRSVGDFDDQHTGHDVKQLVGSIMDVDRF